jgi:hypothetical protein
VSFKQFFAFDSTTIRLFSHVLKGVGRKLKGAGKQKGGMKDHMLTDIIADFLFGERKRHQDAGLGNAHGTFGADGINAQIKDQESLFDCRGISSDTFYQSFGHVLDNRKRQTVVQQTHKKQK